ncbi:TRAP transporter small permease [Rhodobaculum claviforme]|uniref:TRAP transporter small permease protein n=1 Tax=Rhodobaculum claviforme TaxID=1549854 RepID=A0A934TMF9_9RHOB|nr:TRAP transporter small permease [Rhodobaculum claviforme]MBK5927723.1 C4-dicarboxylate ABC transporter permease [Rhodobaculum claviforme]
MRAVWALMRRGHDLVVTAMAVVAGLALVWLMVAIVWSVGMRNLGMQPHAWLFTSTEYGVFYMTMLGAPWLVRRRGHVHIELVTATLPDGVRALVSRAVAAGCVVVCGYLAWRGYLLVQTNIARMDFDVRAYFYPRWLLTIAFPVSFGLMAVEFARFAVGRELMHTGQAGIHE